MPGAPAPAPELTPSQAAPAPPRPPAEDAPPDSDAGALDAASVDPEAVPDAAVEDAPLEPPAATTGVIEGEIASLEDGSPVAAAKVYVRGEPIEAETGTDGRFVLTLAPGAHRISVIHGLHETQTADVEVAAGQTITIRLELMPAKLEFDEFVVTAPRIKGTVASVLAERRESASVVDAISVADISKSPDGTASAATRRIVGATIVGGQFLYVRGLGGRYTTVRLNGVPMPSTDPDLPGFQLDLFPSSLLSSLNIAKTFTPDIPGDFAGGSMNVVTRDFPTELTVTASVGVTTTTETIGRDVLSYDGGKYDFIGIEDGGRALPSSTKPWRLTPARRGQDGFTTDEVNEISGEFPRFQDISRTGWRPNLNLGVSVGDTAYIGGHRLGLLGTLGYRYSFQRSRERIVNVRPADDDPSQLIVRDDLDREIGTERALIGALGSASFELAKGHEISAVTMLTQNGEDRASLVTGLSEGRGTEIERTQLRYIERQLFFNQLLLHHDFEAVVLDAQLNISTVGRDQPDTRDALYALEGERQEFAFNTGSGERLYSTLAQQDIGGGVDVTVPIEETKLKSGYMGRYGERDFSARRFLANRLATSSGQTVDELLRPQDAGMTFRYQERTLEGDGYLAEEELHAAYAMIDTPTLRWLRLTAGARIESARQSIEVGTPYATSRPDEPLTSRVTTDVLPAAAATVALSDAMSVRAAYGGTVARPLVRELAPSQNIDYVRRRVAVGNPDLKRTYVHNFDLRWELFPSDIEVFAASAFYKIFQNPIESVVLLGGDFTYDNIESAQNYGLELEARIGLDRLWAPLEDFSLGANLAIIQSNVSLTREQLTEATSKSRPMAGQSPYVANLSLGYSDDDTGLSLNVFYNVFGKRIRDVGVNRMPDIYDQPFHSLDLTAVYEIDSHFRLSASATNLLVQALVAKQGRFEVLRVEDGMGFGLTLSYQN